MKRTQHGQRSLACVLVNIAGEPRSIERKVEQRPRSMAKVEKTGSIQETDVNVLLPTLERWVKNHRNRDGTSRVGNTFEVERRPILHVRTDETAGTQ